MTSHAEKLKRYITLDGNWIVMLDNKEFLLINDGDNDFSKLFSAMFQNVSKKICFFY